MRACCVTNLKGGTYIYDAYEICPIRHPRVYTYDRDYFFLHSEPTRFDCLFRLRATGAKKNMCARLIDRRRAK